MASAMMDRPELRVHREQHVEGSCHGAALLWNVGQQARDVAAEFRPSGAAGLGQEDDEVTQRREPDGVDDLPALTRGLRQPRPLQCAEMKGCRRGRQADALGDDPRGKAGRSGRHQQAQDREPGLGGQGAEDLDGVHHFHVSTLMEIYAHGKPWMLSFVGGPISLANAGMKAKKRKRQANEC